MGPGDPLSPSNAPNASGPSPSAEGLFDLGSDGAARGHSPNGATSVVSFGALIGGAFGLLLVFASFGAALLVTVCAFAGMAAAYLLGGVTSGRLNPRGALDAFFRRGS